MDRVTDYSMKSLCRHLMTAVSGLVGAYQVSTDFDWDKSPNPSNPGNQLIPRLTPFIGAVIMSDIDKPFTMGNILYEREIKIHLELCCQNHTQLMRLSSDVRQSLITAMNQETSSVGIPLYNYAVASGSYYANAGTLQIELGPTQYFGSDKSADQGNRKYLSITPIELSAFKDATATLLENMGRVDVTDS